MDFFNLNRYFNRSINIQMTVLILVMYRDYTYVYDVVKIYGFDELDCCSYINGIYYFF